MWENQPEDINDNKTPAPRWRRNLIVPVAVSLLIHGGLLLVMHQSLTGNDDESGDTSIPAPSIQITFRSRPLPQAQVEPSATEQLPDANTADQLETSEQVVEPSAQQDAQQELSEPALAQPVEALPPPRAFPDEPQSQAPRLIAPSLLDLRDRIRNQAQSDSTGRIFSNAECDERQRRNDLIDCGDEDPNNRYGFDEVEQNDTTEFFAGLEAPTGVDRSAPRDATNPDTRAAVARDNLTGNLGAGPLIRSVMGQP